MATSSICASCLRALRTAPSARLARPTHPTQHLSTRTPTTHLQSSHFSTTRSPQTNTPAPSPPSKQPPPPPPPPAKQPPRAALASLARQLRDTTTLRSVTEPLVAYGVTEELYALCAQQCSYTVPSLLAKPPAPAPKNAGGEDVGVGEGWWFATRSGASDAPSDLARGLGLDVTFNSWAQVQFLHLYVLTARFRRFPREHVTIWQQHLLDHFFYAAEDRMAVWHGMSARGVRNKHLKDLWLQWRGILLSYDEGLIRGDAVLAGAVWRNLFKGQEGVEVGRVAAVVGYLRKQMKVLEGLGDGEVARGLVDFGDAGSVVSGLGLGGRRSGLIDRPFTAEELSAGEEGVGEKK